METVHMATHQKKFLLTILKRPVLRLLQNNFFSETCFFVSFGIFWILQAIIPSFFSHVAADDSFTTFKFHKFELCWQFFQTLPLFSNRFGNNSFLDALKNRRSPSTLLFLEISSRFLQVPQSPNCSNGQAHYMSNYLLAHPRPQHSNCPTSGLNILLHVDVGHPKLECKLNVWNWIVLLYSMCMKEQAHII